MRHLLKQLANKLGTKIFADALIAAATAAHKIGVLVTVMNACHKKSPALRPGFLSSCRVQPALRG
jgi:hypothetical protein